jgi:hypothetical protein
MEFRVGRISTPVSFAALGETGPMDRKFHGPTETDLCSEGGLPEPLQPAARTRPRRFSPAGGADWRSNRQSVVQRMKRAGCRAAASAAVAPTGVQGFASGIHSFDWGESLRAHFQQVLKPPSSGDVPRIYQRII